MLNNDTIINKNFCKEIEKTQKKFKNAGIISPKFVYMSNPKKIQVAGGGHFTKVCPTGENQIGANEIDTGKYEKETEIDFGYGAGWVLTPKCINKVGLLDNDWFLGFEEPDFCLRTKSKGFTTIYCPKAIVEHDIGGTSKGKKKFWIKFAIKRVYARNYFRFLIKHYSLSKATKIQLKRTLNAALNVKKPHLICLELYSIIWNIIFLPKTLLTKRRESYYEK